MGRRNASQATLKSQILEEESFLPALPSTCCFLCHHHSLGKLTQLHPPAANPPARVILLPVPFTFPAGHRGGDPPHRLDFNPQQSLFPMEQLQPPGGFPGNSPRDSQSPSEDQPLFRVPKDPAARGADRAANSSRQECFKTF